MSMLVLLLKVRRCFNELMLNTYLENMNVLYLRHPNTSRRSHGVGVGCADVHWRDAGHILGPLAHGHTKRPPEVQTDQVHQLADQAG